MAGIVAGSIAGWSPVERREGDESFATRMMPLDSREAIENTPGIELHPDTSLNDPVIVDTDDLKAAPSQVKEARPDSTTNAPTSRQKQKEGNDKDIEHGVTGEER